MTVLSAVQKACAEALSLSIPDLLFAATKREWVELQYLANSAAEYIARDHDWQSLKKAATITGDGTTETFALNTQMDRMLVKAGLWSSTRLAPLRHVPDTDEWLGLVTLGDQSAFGMWTMYGDEIHIRPAPSLAETVTYYYISNRWALRSGGTYAAEFTADTDTFVLSETLLKLAIVWMYKQAKGREYAEDMATYEREKERIIARDGGSKIIRIGGTRLPAGVDFAYPLAVGT